MDTKVLPAFGLMLFTSAVGSASLHAADTRTPPPAESVAGVDDADASPTVASFSSDVPVQRHYYDVATGQVVSIPPDGGSGTPGELVYSCTPPPSMFLPPGPNRLIADDVTTVAGGECGGLGCDMTAYEIAVRRSVGRCEDHGGWLCDSDADCPMGLSCTPWDDPDFGVEFAVWDDCPGNVGAQIIPGTQGSIRASSAGVHTIIIVFASPIPIPKSFWVSTVFDAPGAGWIVGTPADIGFTEDKFYFQLPGFFCSWRTGDSSVYAGFHVRVFCEAPVDREFLAYLNPELDGWAFQPGANRWLVDDVELIVDDCVLTALEIGVAGIAGQSFTIDAEIWRFCNSNTVVEGTQQSQVLLSDGTPQWVCFDYPGGIQLPMGNSFSVAWKFSNASVAIIAEQATIGYTDSWLRLSDGGQCDVYIVEGLYAGFALTLRCAGDAPLGACCDLAGSEGAYCRETTEINCQGSLTRWRAGVTCDDPEAFDPPCGYSACCEPSDVCNDRPFVDDGSVGGCSEIFDGSQATCRFVADDPESGNGEACTVDGDCPEGQICSSNPAVWRRGLYCTDPDTECPRWLCRFAEGACDVVHGGLGCNNPICCDKICEQDGWCCDVAWDASCVAKAVRPPESGGCGLLAANDECWVGNRCAISRDHCSASSDCPPGEECEPDTDFGAIMLNKCTNHTGPGDPSCMTDADCLNDETCEANGVSRTSNAIASTNSEGIYSASEELCCHPDGAGMFGTNGVWAKFIATSDTAMLDTCFSDTPGTNTILQVFRVGDPSSLESACNSLSVIACNDDAAATCSGDGNSRVCLSDLTVGATYYVLLATAPNGETGNYKIRITSPASISTCGDPDDLPANDRCSSPDPINGNAELFDLASATLDCPYPNCVHGVDSDAWFFYTPIGTGVVTMETCGADALSSPDTTLLVYAGAECPVDADRVVACNDDAPKTCSGSGEFCDTVADCNACDGSGGPCLVDDDCKVCSITDTPCVTAADCGFACSDAPDPGAPGFDDYVCTSSSDCKRCSETGEICTRDLDCPSDPGGPNQICADTGVTCDTYEICGVSGDGCTVSGDTCDNIHDGGDCGGGSVVTFAVETFEPFLVRIGGKNGNEPSGVLTISDVQPDCNQNGRADADDIACGAGNLCTRCFGMEGCAEVEGSADCNCNGIPDECGGGCPDIQIVGSTPASGSIDAGQPSDPDGQNPTGWSSVTIDFDGATETLSRTDFIISVTGGAAPSVIHVASEGNSATLTLDAPIPVGQWTRITHCGSGTSICLGYLPADVNGDGTTAPSDILGLLDSLNGVAPLPDYSVDVDRSGDPGPPDVLRVIDLLNGAAAYDPWIHVSLPASPCAP